MLALAASTLSPMTANAIGPSSNDPNVIISKVWAGSVNNGGVATATITLTRVGPAGTTTGIDVTDIYDPGLVFQSASIANSAPGSACTPDNTTGFKRIVCTGLSTDNANPATITLSFKGSYWGYRHYTKNYETDERLEIQKAETHVDIQSGTFETATVTCPANYDILDYSWHLQQVDQGTGDFYDVYVQSSSINSNSATVQLFNDAGGKAQGKLWALCLKNTTNQAHPVGWGGQQVFTERLAPDGPFERPMYAECPQGSTPMAIMLSAAVVPGQSDPLSTYQDDLIRQTGLEADGSRRAVVWADILDVADVTLRWRCLDTSVSANRLWFEVKTASQAAPAQDKVLNKSITCSDGYKGVIGGWRGGHFNGSEPRPLTRTYWLWHNGPGAKQFDGKLLCLKSRLVRGGKVKKNGTVHDPLWNHARGTTQGNAFYINNVTNVSTNATQLN